jgi:hypothetical protein
MAHRAEIPQQTHHVVIMFWRRRAAAEYPVEQIGVGAIEQRFESVELDAVQAFKGLLGERAKDEITLLRPSTPTPEQQSPGADIKIFVV